MEKFYFTYGSSKSMPHQNGWTVIIADDINQACEAFNKIYPPRHDDVLNCAFRYTEEEFKATKMHETGNGGDFCHETLNAHDILMQNPYIDVNIDKELVYIIYNKSGLIKLPYTVAKVIGEEISRIPHYEDIKTYIENSEEYDDSLLLDDELIKQITDDYHNLRLENDGGCCDYTMNFRECLDKIFNRYGSELLVYRLVPGINVHIKHDDKLIARTIKSVSHDDKLFVTFYDNTTVEVVDVNQNKNGEIIIETNTVTKGE